MGVTQAADMMSVTNFLGIMVRSRFRSLMVRVVWVYTRVDNGSQTQNDLKKQRLAYRALGVLKGRN